MVNRFFEAVTKGGGRQGWLYLLALAAATGGVIAIVVGITHQVSAPQPPASAAGHVSVRPNVTVRQTSPKADSSPSQANQSDSGKSSDNTSGESLPASLPVSIDIPAIDVHSSVLPIGKAPDGTLAVPQPGPDLNKAAWYKGSATPGQAGPSVIEGHIDTDYGPSVFLNLGALRPGDKVSVTRRDSAVATFTINAVRSYASKDEFPTSVVYGGDLSQPTLRLITCSNFDESTGHYLGNSVVFAHLTSVQSAKPAARQ